MKKKMSFLMVIAVLVLCSVNMSNAALIQGFFTGTISDSYSDILNTDSGVRITRPDLLVGTNLTGTFAYDTDLAPLSSSTFYGQYKQPGSVNWLTITLQLNDTDKTTYQTESQNIEVGGVGEAYDRVTILNDWGSLDQDSFNAEERVKYNLQYSEGSSDLFYYHSNGMLVRHSNNGGDFLDSIDLIQDFIVDDNLIRWPYSYGSYYLTSYLYDETNGKYLSYSSQSIQYDINSITVSSASPVPEPSTLLLLGCGLAGLFWYNRKHKKT